MRKRLCFAAAFCSLVANAQIGGISLYGVGSYSRPTVTGVPGAMVVTPMVGLAGGGLGVELGSSHRLAIDVQYLPRAFNDGFNDVRMNVVEGSLTYRYWLWDVIAIDLGGYAAYGLSLTQNAVASSYDAYGAKKLDAGGVGGLLLQYRFGSWSAFAGGRVTYSLLNSAAASGQTMKFTDVVAMAGLRFGLGGSSGFGGY